MMKNIWDELFYERINKVNNSDCTNWSATCLRRVLAKAVNIRELIKAKAKGR